MVKRKFDKNQRKLGIKTLDWNVPKDHISCFVVDFIEDVKIAFTGDIFINMKDMIPKQVEYNRYAPILMTSVDFDSDLCREERNELFNKLNTGKWKIFGGHGGKKIYESN